MRLLFVLLTLILGATAQAATFYVATTGDNANPGTAALPWRTLQKACNTVPPGSTVLVAAGVYNEKVTVNVSGTAAGGFVTLNGSAGAVVSGLGKAGKNLIYINNKSYLKIIGFELKDNLAVSDGSGIRVEGAGSHLEFRNNTIHNVKGTDAMGITIYGTVGATPVSDLVIDGNEIYDCQPAQSEALTLNGNVSNFQITNNFVHDVNNIGIDMIGGEGMCPNSGNDAARNGLCRGNRVFRARSNYGGGYAGAIYVDGGRDIIIERNVTSESDVGLEIGCENAGFVVSNVTVRDNLIYNNDKVGIVFGGYDSTTGRVKNCKFLNNTCTHNDTLHQDNGELWIQYASSNVVSHNIFDALPGNKLLSVIAAGGANALDYNLWHGDAGAIFTWRDTDTTGFAAYRAASAQDAHSLFAAPKFLNAAVANFHLMASSLAINAGDPAFVPGAGETDFYGKARLQAGRVDIGADETPPPPAAPTNLTALLSGSDVVLNWQDHATNESGTKVFRSSDGIHFTLLASLPKNATTYTDTAAPANTLLYYLVRAYNTGGTTTSNTVSIHTP